MTVILWAAFLLSAASYVASAGLFVAQARRRPATHVRPIWPPRLLELGAALHLAYLVVFSVMDHRCPVYSMHSALGIISLVGVVTYAVLSRGRHLEALGGFVAGTAALFLIAAHSITARQGAPNDRWLLAIHITANFLGGGIVLIAGAAAAFYIWSDRRLRKRRSLGTGPKLPPLESLDSVLHRLLWIGMPLLTIGVLTGRLVIKHAEVVSLGDRVRAALSIGSWLVLLLVLFLRQFRSWRGRRPAYAALFGTLGILIVIVLYVARAMLGVG